MRIIVDQDEVLAQFVEEILLRWNTRAGTNFRAEDINMWAMEKTFGADSKEWIEATIREPGLFDNLKPVKDAIWGVRYLNASGHDVVIATHIADGNENVYDAKRRWIKKYIPGFDYRNFACLTRKELLSGDILIDDGAHNIEGWMRAGRKNPIVFDRPWNRKLNIPTLYNGPHKIYRAYDWEGLIKIIDAIDEEEKYYAKCAEHGIIS
jgi:5'(3')-deoxyribonucleotidase